MTITVTPDDSYSPPRVAIEVAVEAGGSMQVVAVYRTADGVRELINPQPSTGLDERLVYDYWAPYEVPITYDWECTYIGPDAITTILAETWANLSAWTVVDGVGGTWAASGGKLIRQNGPDRGATVRKSVASQRSRITFAAVPVGVPLIDFGDFQINTESKLIIGGGKSTAYLPGTGSWVIDVAPGAVSFTTSEGVFSLPAPGMEVDRVDFLGSTLQLSQGTPFAFPQPTVGQTWDVWDMVVTGSRLFAVCMLNLPSQLFRVVVCDLAGAYLTHIDLPSGSANGSMATTGVSLNTRVAIAVDGSGRLIITDPGNVRVQRFTISGTGASTTIAYFDKFGTAGSGDGQFTAVGDVCCDGSGNIYVVDRAGSPRIQRFTSAGAYAAKWSTVGAPTAIEASGSSVYAVHPGSSTVSIPTTLKKTDSAGVLQASVSAWTYSALDTPRAIVIANGVIFLSNYAGKIETFALVDFEQFASLPATRTSGTTVVPLAVNGAALYECFRTVPTLPPKASIITASQSVIDDVTIEGYGAPIPLAETADPVTLTPDEAWLIHPSKPSLSVPIGEDNGNGFVADGAMVMPATATTHHPLGEDLGITVVNGPRWGDQGSVVFHTQDADGRKAMRALLRDQTPILIRVPPSWDIDFDDGFYAVRDVRVSRLEQMPGFVVRQFELPIERVLAPSVNVESSWTYAALALAFASYDAVALAYEDYTAVLADDRNGGV